MLTGATPPAHGKPPLDAPMDLKDQAISPDGLQAQEESKVTGLT